MTINIAKHDCTIIWDGTYYFALSDYPNINPWELKKLFMFMEYEKLHGRQTEIVCEDKNILSVVNHAIAHPETVKDALLPTKITECTYCKQRGCLTRFVCHTGSVESAKKIFDCGKLLSPVKSSGKTADELAHDIRNAAKDPIDYFDYIYFAWGNCTAGDSLVTERNFTETHGRHPTQEELNKENDKNLIAGIRFYFRHTDICNHSGYISDGYHSARIKDEVVLTDYLYACIIPEQHRNDFKGLIPSDLSDRVHYIPQDGLGVLDWSERVYEFVERIENI